MGVEVNRVSENSPGWQAIDDACERVHGPVEPTHFSPGVRFALGGKDPLDGISCYAVTDPPHWHFVSYGMSELYRKESKDKERSGWGFEFSMRLQRDEGEPPPWALSFLQNLARYVFRTGNWFQAGHHMSLNGPIAAGADTKLVGVMFVEDPHMQALDTPNGKVSFLQILGVTEDELTAANAWNTISMAKLIQSVDPDGIVVLGRGSVLEIEASRRAFDEGCARDGSLTAALFLGENVKFRRSETTIEFTVGARQVPMLATLLRGRLAFGRPLMLNGTSGVRIRLLPQELAERSTPTKGVHDVVMRPEWVDELVSTLRPERGAYTVAGGELQIVVVPTEVRDHHGRPIRIIG